MDNVIPMLPTVPDLVRRAVDCTRFVAEVTAADPLDLTIAAELAAQLAAERWERAAGKLVGLTVPPELVTQVVAALIVHGTRLQEKAVYAAHAKVERSLSALGAVRFSIAGRLPIPEAEALVDDVEGYLDIIGVKLKRALQVLTVAIERQEAAA